MAKEDIIQISRKIRVEKGLAEKRAVATKELLDDKNTARHYQVGMVDAKGKVIKIGDEMTYLDHRGPRVWYVYKAFIDVKVSAELGREWYRYHRISVHATKEEALTAAQALEE